MIVNIVGIRRSGLHIVSDYITEISKLPFNNNLNHQLYLSNKLLSDSLNLFEDANLLKLDTIKPSKETETSAIKNVIVIRDPLNMAASRIKHYNLISSEGLFISPLALHQWFTYYSFYVNKRQLSGIDTIYVNYNTFINSGSYRSTITNQLTNTENHKESHAEAKILESININGGGSSFDGMVLQSHNEDFHKRYKYYDNVPAFRNLLTKEQLSVAEKAFGLTYYPEGE